jgi:hypothetical protein
MKSTLAYEVTDEVWCPPNRVATVPLMGNPTPAVSFIEFDLIWQIRIDVLSRTMKWQ